jgi:class 3 adenylate cyclase
MSSDIQADDSIQEVEVGESPSQAGSAVTKSDLGPVGLGPVMDSLSMPVAMADPDTMELLFENNRFQEWFPVQGEGNHDLEARVPGLDVTRTRNRTERGRPYRFEVEVKVGPRTITLQMQVKKETGEGGDFLLLEGQNISKQKEAEYMLDSYSRLTERQNRELENEKERVEKLLLNIMPKSVYEELKDSGTTTPQAFDDVSVLMLDFAGFTDMAISRDPGALIAELNDVFTSFDRISEHFRCERIKTIGDAYMAVAGLPEPDPEHAFHLCRTALRMRRFLERRNTSSAHHWRCRIGIGSGPVIGSIVGIQKFVYDIFGPAVNIAARLESLAEPMQILITAETVAKVQDDFVLTSLGELDIKGFGLQEVFVLEEETREGT